MEIKDSNQPALFRKKLEVVQNKTYYANYQQYKFASGALVPISTALPEGATSHVWYELDRVGIAEIIANYGRDIPRVDVVGKENVGKIVTVGNSYGYTTQELRSSIMTGTPLPQQKANAAREAEQAKIDDIAFRGSADHNITGLSNHPNSIEVTLDNTGTGSSLEWDDKNTDQILKDVSDLLSTVIETTDGREVPNTVLVPYAQYTKLKTTPRSANSDTTLLAFIESNFNVKVEAVANLKGAGGGNTDMIIAYVNDSDHLEFQYPMPFKQNIPQLEGLEYIVSCESRVGGLTVYRPLSIARAEGI